VKNQNGFTIIEVIIAILLLSVGLLGLASTAGTVTRMIGQGQRYTEASSLASERFEIIRAQECDSMAAGSATAGGYAVKWTVFALNGGAGQEVNVEVESRTGTGTRVDTFSTAIACEL
jgi:type IV pilus modification protein PilV